MMRIIKDPKEMQAIAHKLKGRGKTIGFVPTMGYLHEGHLSLVEAARSKADIVVVSVFINPTQFSQGEDLAHYPRDLKRDEKLLSNFSVDLLFLPEAGKIYGDDYKTFVEVDGLSKKLCGRTRPTHFRGVATIIAKLFNLVSPDFAFFGEKDFQQQLIIKKMAADLNFPVEIISLPTVREFDGLAMSSRNQCLTPKEREHALTLYKALLIAREEIEKGEKNHNKIIMRLRSILGAVPGMRLDYVAIVDPDTLEEVKAIKGTVLASIAVHLGKARLIDNMLIDAK
jgi:pantoate--beta-alanine ligase